MTQTAFLNLVLPFKDKMYRLAKRLLVSNEEAEDATQEILLKLWTNKTKIAGYNNTEAFAMTMTKNYCFDRLKSKQAQNLRIVHNNYKDESTALQKQIEQKDSLDWIDKLMQQLPKQQQMVMQLRDIEQYEFADIAKVLDMKETAIRVSLSRARKTIREQLIKKHNYGIK
ncbi:MAG: RNA polymerase subunit sigma-70 [Kordia sp.]|nr:MAG: RNA polymerase subunit sigma-70 [Kordia sp.]